MTGKQVWYQNTEQGTYDTPVKKNDLKKEKTELQKEDNFELCRKFY